MSPSTQAKRSLILPAARYFHFRHLRPLFRCFSFVPAFHRLLICLIAEHAHFFISLIIFASLRRFVYPFISRTLFPSSAILSFTTPFHTFSSFLQFSFHIPA